MAEAARNLLHKTEEKERAEAKKNDEAEKKRAEAARNKDPEKIYRRTDFVPSPRLK